MNNLSLDSLRPLLRQIRNVIYRLLDVFTPLVTHRQYLGYKFFYIKGPGIVDRIRFLAPHPIYEDSVCQSITRDLKTTPDSTFIDIGANLGLISLYINHQLPNTKIYAFEPGLQQHALFSLTIAQNNLADQIRLFSYAISDNEGSAIFTTFENAVDGSGDGFINTGRGSAKPITIPVSTLPLDTFIQRNHLEKIDVIKIDIEGAELSALKGMASTISKHRPIIYFEMNPLNFNNYHYKETDLLNFFAQHHYYVTDLSGTMCTAENYHGLFSKGGDMFVARPK